MNSNCCLIEVEESVHIVGANYVFLLIDHSPVIKDLTQEHALCFYYHRHLEPRDISPKDCLVIYDLVLSVIG
jgi:hypothetical protein